MAADLPINRTERPRDLTLDDVLWPACEPFESGLLDVGDGHRIYWEKCGNPAGKPALFLHGGPGAGSGPGSRRLFSPETYMAVVFDQRGCNRSKPSADEDLWGSLKNNTTQDLVGDCEKLRLHCGVEAWHLVVGGSWGSTLAIAYAEAHPANVRSMVLRGVFTGEQCDIDHIFNAGSVADYHPEAWEKYKAHIVDSAPSEAARAEDERCLLAAYYRRLISGDDDTAGAAARAFTEYELTLIKNHKDETLIASFLAAPEKLIPFATFETHYMLHHCFLRTGQLLDECSKLPKDLRVRVAMGRCDFCTRPRAAWALAKSLRANGIEDVVVNFVGGAGHHDSEPPVAAAMVEAIAELGH